MKFKIFFTSILCLTIFSNIVAQSNFIQGTYISNDRTEHSVLIDYQDWSLNPSEIKFKLGQNEAVQKLSPNDVKEFRVGGAIYKTAKIQVEKSPLDVQKLSTKPEFDLEEKTAFLQVIFEGSKNLYSFKDGLKTHLYIGSISNPEPLFYKKYRLNVLNKHRSEYIDTVKILENKRYIGQLTIYFENAPYINARLARTNYNTKDIAALFNAYYKKSNDEKIYSTTNHKSLFKVGLTVSANISDVKFSTSSSVFDYWEDMNFEPVINYSPAITLDIVLPKNRGKWSIHNEMSYSSFKNDIKYTLFNNATDYSDFEYSFKFSSININSLLRYKIFVNKGGVFFNAGATYGHALDNSISATEHKVLNSSITDSEPKVIEGDENYKNYVLGGIAGLGVFYKGLSFETRYTQTSNVIKYPQKTVKANHISFLINYMF